MLCTHASILKCCSAPRYLWCGVTCGAARCERYLHISHLFHFESTLYFWHWNRVLEPLEEHATTSWSSGHVNAVRARTGRGQGLGIATKAFMCRWSECNHQGFKICRRSEVVG
jgi:hypothetical protein